MEAMSRYDMQWAHLGSIILSLMVSLINMYPLVYKERVMRLGNVRANQHLYTLAAEDPSASSAIVLCEQGEAGRYNRANRSLYHTIEWTTPFIFSAVLNAFVFPFPTIAIIVAYILGCIEH